MILSPIKFFNRIQHLENTLLYSYSWYKEYAYLLHIWTKSFNLIEFHLSHSFKNRNKKNWKTFLRDKCQMKGIVHTRKKVIIGATFSPRTKQQGFSFDPKEEARRKPCFSWAQKKTAWKTFFIRVLSRSPSTHCEVNDWGHVSIYNNWPLVTKVLHGNND